MNVFDAPMNEADYVRAHLLSKFLFNNKWTLGEVKRAFVMWYERSGMGREYGDVLLMSDLHDFVEAIVRLRDAPEMTITDVQFRATEADLLGYQAVICEKCKAEMHIPITEWPHAIAGDIDIECKSCHQRYSHADNGKTPTKVIVV